MRSRRDGGGSVATQVKVSIPEIIIIARGQGIHGLEASTTACVTGEHGSHVPGSKSATGQPTVHIGTWEKYLEGYPLPRPKIVHNLYKLSPVL
jgi:hypothetical protein